MTPAPLLQGVRCSPVKRITKVNSPASSNQTSASTFHNPLSESSTHAFTRCPFPSHLAAVIEITHPVSQSRDSFILLDSGDGAWALSLCGETFQRGERHSQSSRLGATFSFDLDLPPTQLAITSAATFPIVPILHCDM